MRAVATFARMTVTELLRRRTIYGILVLMLLALIGLGRIPSFDISSEGRFLLEFGLFTIEIGGLLLAIGLGAGIYPRDRETGNIVPLLAVPLSRMEYMLGRFLGAAVVQTAAMVTGYLGLVGILLINGVSIPATLLPGAVLLIIEAWFLLSVVFFFSFWTSPPLNAPLTVLVFIISQMSIRDFIGLLPSMPGLMRVLRILLPHMDVFHVRDPIAHQMGISPVYFLLAALYGVSYSLFVLSVGLAVLGRRDMK